MRTTLKISFVVVLLMLVNSVAFGTAQYLIANLNNPLSNQANVYKLDTTSGALTQIGALDTQGMGLGQNLASIDSYTDIQQAITSNASCIFVMDGGSNDIATFSKSTNYAKVGSYSNSSLSSNYGGSLGLTPNGKFLYSSYGETGNVAAWVVNTDCSISFIGAYIPMASQQPWPLHQFKITPNGRGLVLPISLATPAVELFAIDPTTGALTDMGYVQIDGCNACLLGGLDITKDNKFAVVAASNYNGVSAVPFAISIEIAPTGLVHPRRWDFSGKIVGNLVYNGEAFLDAGAYAGSGNLYFSAVGNGGNCGVITASFTEKPLSIQPTIATPIASQRVGSIAVTGSTMVIGEYPNQIGTYSISPDGSLSLLSTTAIKNPKDAVFSFSPYPNTR
jgi:hypothetical protein